MRYLVAILGVLVLAVFISLLSAIPVYYLWNWLVPALTKGALATVTFLQAWGLTFLCTMLFKSTTTVNKS